MWQSYHEHLPIWSKKLLPSNIRLLSGPGCPVCVTSVSYIDTAIAISQNTSASSNSGRDVLITTFGDMMRYPARLQALKRKGLKGASVAVVYSTLDALHLAEKYPDKKLCSWLLVLKLQRQQLPHPLLKQKGGG